MSAPNVRRYKNVLLPNESVGTCTVTANLSLSISYNGSTPSDTCCVSAPSNTDFPAVIVNLSSAETPKYLGARARCAVRNAYQNQQFLHQHLNRGQLTLTCLAIPCIAFSTSSHPRPAASALKLAASKARTTRLCAAGIYRSILSWGR
ncbi:Hypothetical protein D9617_13g099010 [Elsinoe fawcettii]|nr:Hypothetical protein D9617_13g099010 [Elsinoe fawcettii]